jgi:hypothetical protein
LARRQSPALSSTQQGQISHGQERSGKAEPLLA